MTTILKPSGMTLAQTRPQQHAPVQSMPKLPTPLPGLRFGADPQLYLNIYKDTPVIALVKRLAKELDTHQVVVTSFSGERWKDWKASIKTNGKEYQVESKYIKASCQHKVTIHSPEEDIKLSADILDHPKELAFISLIPVIGIDAWAEGLSYALRPKIEVEKPNSKIAYKAEKTFNNYGIRRMMKKLNKLITTAAKGISKYEKLDQKVAEAKAKELAELQALGLAAKPVETEKPLETAATPPPAPAPTPLLEKAALAVSPDKPGSLQEKRAELTRLLADLNTVRETKGRVVDDITNDVKEEQDKLKQLKEAFSHLETQFNHAGNDVDSDLVMDLNLQAEMVKAKENKVNLLTQQQENTLELNKLMEHRLKRLAFQYTNALDILDTIERLGKGQNIQTMFESLNRQYKDSGAKAGEALPDTPLQKQYEKLVAQLAQAEQDTRLMQAVLQMDAESALTQLRVKERVEAAKAEMASPARQQAVANPVANNAKVEGDST